MPGILVEEGAVGALGANIAEHLSEITLAAVRPASLVLTCFKPANDHWPEREVEPYAIGEAAQGLRLLRCHQLSPAMGWRYIPLDWLITVQQGGRFAPRRRITVGQDTSAIPQQARRIGQGQDQGVSL